MLAPPSNLLGRGWIWGHLLLSLLLTFQISACQAQAPATISLAKVLTPNPSLSLSPKAESADFFTGKSGDRAAYNTQLAAVGVLIISDDTGLYKTLQGSHENKSLTNIANDLNHLGDLEYVAPALGAVYLSGGQGNRRLAWQAGMAVIKAGIIGEVLKEAVGRQRPDGRDGGDGADHFQPFSFKGDNDQSFPSGHSLVAFSVATVWAHDRPQEKDVAYGLATAVGFARIYTHAHWPSDVFWGAALGISQGRQVLKGDTNLLTIRF